MSRRSSVHSDRSFSARHRSVEDLTDYKAAFVSVVKSINKNITTSQQLTQVLQYCGRNPTAKQVSKIWSQSKDGGMSFQDFYSILKEIKPTSKPQLLEAFHKIDINNDGFISESELYKLFTSRGEKMTRSEVKRILDSADVDHDGRLDYNEFCDLILATTNLCKQCINKKLPTEVPEKELTKPVPNRRLSQGSTQKSSNKRSTTMQKLNDAIIVQGGPISQLNFKSNKPTSLKGWSNVKSKGCFFVEENKDLVGHTYQLELPFASNVYCEVQASTLVGTPDSWTSTVDVGMIVFRKSGEKDDLVFMTEWVDGQKSFWSGDLRSGSYLIVPYTSGCRLTPRVHNDEDLPLTRTDYNDQIQLTKPFCETLLDIFELCDLDGNGRLSREEFNWFHIRTTDEEVDDDAWKVVLENVDTTDGEMTRKGFEQLHLMQAQEAESSPQDELMETITNMGFNGSLDLVQACPFEINIFAKDCSPSLQVASLNLAEEHVIKNAIVRSIEAFSEVVPLDKFPELSWKVYVSDARVSSLLRNKNNKAMELNINCSNSINCLTSQGENSINIQVPGDGLTIVDHCVPQNKNEKWSYHCCITKPMRSKMKQVKKTMSVASSKKGSILSVFE